MTSVEEALALVARSSRDFGNEPVALRQAAGRILSQDVAADRDLPPYDRITMDGIAIAYRAWQDGVRTCRVAGMQAAGQAAQPLNDPHECLEVATGAMLPVGADTVVPYEDCEISDGIARITADRIRPGQHIHRRGTDGRVGAVLLPAHTRITPAVVAVLATVGLSQVPVRRLPRIAVCATGDELVDIAATPAPHQIRRSNSYMLAAALAADGLTADDDHLPDNRSLLKARLAALIPDYDVLLLSGAVSKGALDYLPGVLAELGMETHFHRIAQKPGKPMLFGAFAGGPTVFGFPGNPASTMVCYAVYFRHWLAASLEYKVPLLTARLTADVDFRPMLSYHLLVKLRMQDGVLEATPCAGSNSGDLVSLSAAQAVLTLPAAQQHFAAGESYPLTLLAPFF